MNAKNPNWKGVYSRISYAAELVFEIQNALDAELPVPARKMRSLKRLHAESSKALRKLR